MIYHFFYKKIKKIITIFDKIKKTIIIYFTNKTSILIHILRLIMTDNDSKIEQQSIEMFDEIKNQLFLGKFDVHPETKEVSIREFTAPTIKTINVGTVFSGIGSFEHALKLLKVPHNVAFACDNGGNMFEDLLTATEKIHFNNITDESIKLDFVESKYRNIKKKNFVKESYLANYKIPDKDFFHDIRFIGGHINKKLDIFVGGSPCQSFSVAGARGGFEDTRGTLFFEFARCVKEMQPEVFIYENVKGLTHHDKGQTFKVVLNTFDDLGYKYHYQIINSKDYDIPQKRDRIFIIGFKNHDVNFTFPTKRLLQTTMADFLIGKVDAKYNLTPKGIACVCDETRLKKKYTQINGEIALCQTARQIVNSSGNFVSEKYFLSEKLIKTILATECGNAKFRPTINTDLAKTLLASMSKMHRAGVDNYVTVDGRLRKLTPRECLRLMGFCDHFEQVVSDAQMYKQCGNSIVVDVLMAIIQQIIATGIFNKE